LEIPSHSHRVLQDFSVFARHAKTHGTIGQLNFADHLSLPVSAEIYQKAVVAVKQIRDCSESRTALQLQQSSVTEQHTLGHVACNNTTAGPGEIRKLRLKDIDTNDWVLTVREGAKNDDRVRHIPLNDEAQWAMTELLKTAKRKGAYLPEHYLLPHRGTGLAIRPAHSTLGRKPGTRSGRERQKICPA
jgi:hypothetical protein